MSLVCFDPAGMLVKCSGFGPPPVEKPQPAPQPAQPQPDGGKGGQPIPEGMPRTAVSPYIISTYWMAMASKAKGQGTTATNTGATGTGATGQGDEVRTPDSSGGGRGYLDTGSGTAIGGGFDDSGVGNNGLLHRVPTWLLVPLVVLAVVGLVAMPGVGAAAAGGLFLFSQDRIQDKQS